MSEQSTPEQVEASGRLSLQLAIQRVGRACGNGGPAEIVGSDLRTILSALSEQAREIARLRSRLEIAERERDEALEQLRIVKVPACAAIGAGVAASTSTDREVGHE